MRGCAQCTDTHARTHTHQEHTPSAMQGKEGKNGKRAAPAAKAKKVDRNAGPARWN